MTSDRILYFGFSIMFVSVLLFIIALILIQPVKLDFEADITGGFKDSPTALNGLNATIHITGQAEVPVYALDLITYSNINISDYTTTMAVLLP